MRSRGRLAVLALVAASAVARPAAAYDFTVGLRTIGQGLQIYASANKDSLPFGDFLDPVNTWRDKAEFDKTARSLVGMFQKNFAKFEAQVDAEVRAAAPDLKLAAE